MANKKYDIFEPSNISISNSDLSTRTIDKAVLVTSFVRNYSGKSELYRIANSKNLL